MENEHIPYEMYGIEQLRNLALEHLNQLDEQDAVELYTYIVYGKD